ncbi:MAG: hypothetical protein APR55_07065 [Methanolinea sp. SDB]|nr:MAG: hypothetical protein APR55_07065 [Methanolinea sp. SDB]
MDDCDCAAELSEIYLANALAKQRAKTQAGGISRSECIDCGEEIPEDRRLAAPGCERCVRCQAIFERKI